MAQIEERNNSKQIIAKAHKLSTILHTKLNLSLLESRLILNNSFCFFAQLTLNLR